MKLTDHKIAEWEPQKILVFGDSKTGKSTLAGMLARMGFYLDWFDLENGYKILRKLPLEIQERVNLFKIPDTKSWPIAIETISKVVKGTKGNICLVHGKMACNVCDKEKSPDYPTEEFDLRTSYGPKRILVIDSGTQLGISAINRVISGQDDTYKAGWEDYRKQGTLLDGVYSHIQQAWYNVIVICHTTQARMEDETKTKLVPVSGTDNYSRNLAKFFDHVVYCETGLGAHKFGSSTIFRPSILTGSRTDVAIENMKEPNLLPFFDGSISTAKEVPSAVATLNSASLKATSLLGNLKKS